MKKLLGIAVAAALFIGIAGQAMASLADYDLIRVVYQLGGTVEVVTDLGTLSQGGGTINLATASNLTVGGGSAAISYTMFNPSATSWADVSNVYVAYFAKKTTEYDAWVSGPLTGQRSGAAKISTFSTAGTNIQAYYNGLGIAEGGTMSGEQSNINSYWKNMDKSGGSNIGTFAGLIPLANGEMSLTALADVGYVDQALYAYDWTGSSAPAKDGVQVALLRTMADGSTIINPNASAVPVPASLLLFAPGLLALVGLRKKVC